MTRLLLAGAGITMVVIAALRTAGSKGISYYFIFAERELEIAIVVTLVLLLAVTRYYGVVLSRPLPGIVFGLAFYSSVVVINNSILFGPLALPWTVWSAVRVVAFDLALVSWFLAIRRPLPDPVQPALHTEAQFEEVSVAMDQRMRELNAKLLQLMKR